MVALVHLFAVAAPVFVIASLAMPAGIGGGMLYVPLLIVTHVADPRLAAVLAQPIIVGAALAGNSFNIAWQLRHKEQHLLDGHLALAMIAPCLAGNLVGSIMNQWLPSAIIMILLLLLAATTFQNSARRALRMWRAESASQAERNAQQRDADRAETAPPPAVVGREIELSASAPAVQTRQEETDDTPYTHTSFFSDSTPRSDQTLTRRRTSILPLPANVPSTAVSQAESTTSSSFLITTASYWVWVKLILVWVCMIVVVALRGGSGHSIIDITSCSWEYWLVTVIGFLVLMIVGALTRQPEAPWYMCLTVGALSAVVGIGGAIVLNPMMVERGVDVPAATATASLIVLVMSTCSTSLFLLGGFVPPLPAVVLGLAAFLGSMCGKTVVSYLVSKTGRTSLLVILLAFFLAVSGVTVLVEGSIDSVKDFKAGENPFTSFTLPC